MKRALQSSPAPSQEPQGNSDVRHQPRQLRGWRTVKQLTAELQFSSPRACRKWLAREGIAAVRRGKRTLLIDGLDVDKALRKVSA